MYSLYSSVVQGTLTMSDFMEKIQEYMEKNNISQEKFVNIQKKLMEKYTEAYGINFKRRRKTDERSRRRCKRLRIKCRKF